MVVQISPPSHIRRKANDRSSTFLVRNVLMACGAPQKANRVAPIQPMDSISTTARRWTPWVLTPCPAAGSPAWLLYDSIPKKACGPLVVATPPPIGTDSSVAVKLGVLEEVLHGPFGPGSEATVAHAMCSSYSRWIGEGGSMYPPEIGASIPANLGQILRLFHGS